MTADLVAPTNPDHTHPWRTTHNGITWRLVCICERSVGRLLRERADALRIAKAKRTPTRDRETALQWVVKVDAELYRRGDLLIADGHPRKATQ